MLLAQVVLSMSRVQGDGTARTNPRKTKKRKPRKTIAFPGSIEPAFPQPRDETLFGVLENIVPATPTHTQYICAALVHPIFDSRWNWPAGGTAHLERDAWQLAAERIRIPKRLGGWGIPAQCQNALWDGPPPSSTRSRKLDFKLALKACMLGTETPATRHLPAHRSSRPAYSTG
jgi:hypothetical protein